MHKAIRRHVSDAVIALWHAAERAVKKGISITNHVPSAGNGENGRAVVTNALDQSLTGDRRLRDATAALVLEIDNFRKIEEAYDRDLIEAIMQEIDSRLAPLLNNDDLAVHLEGPRFAVAVSSQRKLNLEAAIQFATRIQHAMAEPIKLDHGSLYITISSGFALAARLESPTGAKLLRAASIAQLEASRDGPNAIRSYSQVMHQRIKTHNGLREEVQAALENNEITAFFQPQIDLTTGALTGLEALARWEHPRRGLIPPSDFLPLLEQCGFMEHLGELMLENSLTALTKWDAEGVFAPCISINMSTCELRNPNLVDHIMMELDRHRLTPDRLVIEVLETVVVTGGDTITETNLNKLAKMGCGIDLDDFGTGHASITCIRKLAIQRIKIDRSFITNLDRDTDQQDMVAAILTMANRLGLATLAEGVETPQEQDQLTQMGCQHMQGFALARPTSFADTTRWLRSHQPLKVTPADHNHPAIRRVM